MKLSLYALITASLITTQAYGGKDDDPVDAPRTNVVHLAVPITDSPITTHTTITNNPFIKLDEGNVEEGIVQHKRKPIYRIIGQMADCSTKGFCTLVGFGIGTGIMDLYLDSNMATGYVLKAAMPVFIGMGAGYFTGWGVGAYVNYRIATYK